MAIDVPFSFLKSVIIWEASKRMEVPQVRKETNNFIITFM